MKDISRYRARSGHVEAPGQPSVVELLRPTLLYPTLPYPTLSYPTLEYQIIKGDKTCGGPWAAFSSRAVEAYPTLEYQKTKGDRTYVEAPGQPSVVKLWRPTLP